MKLTRPLFAIIAGVFMAFSLVLASATDARAPELEFYTAYNFNCPGPCYEVTGCFGDCDEGGDCCDNYQTLLCTYCE